MRPDFGDFAFLVGAMVALEGIALIHFPASLIVGGAFLMFVGVRLPARLKNGDRNKPV